MEKQLYINPPSLLRWQPKDRRSAVVFLDLEPDFLGDHTIRLDLNIVFRPIAVKHGLLDKADFYIGSTGARIGFETESGKVTDYTRGEPFKVEYEKTYKRLREAAVKLSPKLEIGSAKGNVSEVTFDKNNESTFNAKFSGVELTLTDTFLGYGVEWEFVPAAQVIRDYLAGNLFLYVEACWKKGPKAGTIKLRPSDVRFFDSNRKLIGSKPHKAWLMLFFLMKRKKGQRVNSEPTVIEFTELS